MTNSTSVEHCSQFPTPTPLKYPTSPTTDKRLPEPLLIPKQPDSKYLRTLRSLENDPQLPSPKFGGGKSVKKFGFADNVLLSMLDINIKNVREWEILDPGASSHFLVSAAVMSNKSVATSLGASVSEGTKMDENESRSKNHHLHDCRLLNSTFF